MDLLVAILALLVSAWAAYSAHRAKRDLASVLARQAKVAELEIESYRKQENASRSASFVCTVDRIGTQEKLVIRNVGGATAQGFKITSQAQKSEVADWSISKLPIDLESGAELRLVLLLTKSSNQRETFVFNWRDLTGDNEKVVMIDYF